MQGPLMATQNKTDRDWDKWGKENPYFGVITHAKFLGENLNDDSVQEFFASGEEHVEHVYKSIRANVQPGFQPLRILDYGCGVGRLVVPFARRAQSVVGIDVSHGMLEQAKENCKRFALPARLLHFDELDTLAPESFDLVHSYIVFQHIPAAQGDLILRKLIALIAKDGVGAIHFVYRDTGSALLRAIRALRKRVSFVHGMLNLARHMPFSSPQIQMNCYSMNRIFDLLHDTRCSNVHVEFSDHGGFRGVMLYFVRSPRALL
jgi:SAM-dependent methyltransferase